MEIAAKRIRPISRATSWLPRDRRFRRTEPVLTLGGTRRLILAVIIVVAGHRGYRLLTTGAATIDVGVGRRVRSLGPRSWDIAAGRELVFDVIARPYLARTPRALEDKLQVWERGSDMVLAAHVTPVEQVAPGEHLDRVGTRGRIRRGI